MSCLCMTNEQTEPQNICLMIVKLKFRIKVHFFLMIKKLFFEQKFGKKCENVLIILPLGLHHTLTFSG